MNKTLIALLFCFSALAIFGCAPQARQVSGTPAARASPTTPEQIQTPVAQSRTVCAGGNLNVRSDASVKAAILGTLPDGESLLPVSTPGGSALSMRVSTDGGKWLEVRNATASLHGWVNSRYLCPTPTPELP